MVVPIRAYFFFAALNFAQRFLWAAAILARPASEIVRPPLPLDPVFKLLKVRIAFSTCRSCPSNRFRWFFNSFTAAAIDMIVPLKWNCSRVNHLAFVKHYRPELSSFCNVQFAVHVELRGM
jgi:hypothetical protein